MRSILPSVTFWVFVVWSCVVLGGSLYEAVAVWPVVAANLSQPLDSTNQLLTVPARAGMFFWSWATPGLGLVGLAGLLTSFSTPQPHRTWRIASTVLLLVIIAATLLYFRPTIISLVVDHGGGRTDGEIAAQMGRWVTFNWVRVTALAVSVGMGVRALLLPKS
jgi:Domain of unknown function (DUF1772)